MEFKPLPKQQLPNHIEKYFNNRTDNTDFKILFEANKDNVDLRTDLTIQEIILVNIIHLNGDFLENKGLKNNIYNRFIERYERLKISLDRKSRHEFVQINQRENTKDTLEKINTFANLKKVKE